jgi:hypothetical protein
MSSLYYVRETEKSISIIQEKFKVVVGRTACFRATFCTSLEKNIEVALCIWMFDVMYVTIQQQL